MEGSETDPRIFRAKGQCPRMVACVMHWYSAVSRAALCLQENLTALYLLCREQHRIRRAPALVLPEKVGGAAFAATEQMW